MLFILFKTIRTKLVNILTYFGTNKRITEEKRTNKSFVRSEYKIDNIDNFFND